MAQLTIRLRVNPETGRPEVLVGLRSDEDAAALEHERQHRELVRRLVHGREGPCGEEGPTVIEREEHPLMPVAGYG